MSFTCIVRLPDGRDATYHTEGPPEGDDPIVTTMQQVHRKMISGREVPSALYEKITRWLDEPLHEAPVQQV